MPHTSLASWNQSDNYRSVNASSLLKLGILKTISTPVDGVDRNAHIDWSTVHNLTLEVREIDDETYTGLVVHYLRNGASARQGFSVDKTSVASVSGAHKDGRACLNREQLSAIDSLRKAALANAQQRDATLSDGIEI